MSNLYNSPDECIDVCQGLFLFETNEDGFDCCENSRSMDRGFTPSKWPKNTTIPWNSCFGRGPAQQYITYFYGSEIASTMSLPPLGAFSGGSGSDCDAVTNPPVTGHDDVPTTAPGDENTTVPEIYLIIGGIVGGIVIVVILFLFLRNNRKNGRLNAFRNNSNFHSNKKSKDKIAMVEGPVNITSDILVSTQDDVSTLGEPVQAMFTTPEREDTVGSLDYDYQIEKIKQQQQQQEEESLRVASLPQPPASLLQNNNNNHKRGQSSSDISSTPTFSKSRLEDSLFSDDASFERQFVNQMEERLEVIAPAGKLGMVVDRPIGGNGAPVIHAIKESSVLSGKVMIGDRLLSVDDEDTTEYTAAQVSKLITQKEKQPQRVLVLARTKGVSNRSASLENLVE